jgi:transposase
MEMTMRRPAMPDKPNQRASAGKKNWLFAGEASAGERSAIIYPLIDSCRRRGLDPYAYLRAVLTRLPNMTNRQIHEVTPQAWSKKRLPVQRRVINVAA